MISTYGMASRSPFEATPIDTRCSEELSRGCSSVFLIGKIFISSISVVFTVSNGMKHRDEREVRPSNCCICFGAGTGVTR